MLANSEAVERQKAVVDHRGTAFRSVCRPALFRVPGFDVDVWTFTRPSCSRTAALLWPLLNTQERSRAEAFRFAHDQYRFVITHGALRIILGHYVDVPPAELDFLFSRRGKPALKPTPGLPDIRFNLSHSGSRAMLAIAPKREVGVDIECIDARHDGMAIAERFFSLREREALWSLPSDEREQGFFSCWTRKEAYLKARGDGLFTPLQDFDVSVAPGGPVLLVSRIEPGEADRWHIQELPTEPGYVAALAVERT